MSLYDQTWPTLTHGAEGGALESVGDGNLFCATCADELSNETKSEEG